MTQPFELRDPLPTGITVLEASAGTGKTWAIAALAARYVAEGTPLERLLLVTFTRMATGELRDRVRERLVQAERGLEVVLAGGDPGDDPVVALLAEAAEDEVRRRHRNLARALAGFDAATIATTHGFCQEVLAGLGVAGDVEPGTTFLEDAGDLVDEVVDDLYVRRFVRHDGRPDLTREEAAAIARIAIANPAAPIEPQDAPAHSIAAMRVRLAMAARQELERRKRGLAVMTYDDLLTRLDATLRRSPEAAERLRERHEVVLVDEFQDTDPVQWDILRRAFGSGVADRRTLHTYSGGRPGPPADSGATLVLIGDPKQAIYAFRGADVFAYLEAARAATTTRTLEVNWRSDQGLIDAYDALFAGARLGHEGIVYRTVRAAPEHQAPRLRGAPAGAPLRVRVVHRDEPTVNLTRQGFASNQSAREHIAQDLAADVVALLSSDAEVDGEPVQPGHLAVLVRTHRNASLVRDALDEAGVPAVINGAGSVFATTPAREWLRLLEAIERPASTPRARAAALTCFLGWTPERLAAADEDDWEAVHRRLHQWARVLRLRGVAAMTETITLAEGLPGRILAAADGERRLTDLRHVAQLLHAAATAEHLGTTALTAWLRRRIADAEREQGDEERSRRLESDAEAVQVLTIHRSKGLEFPIVYFPYLWEPGYIPRGEHPVDYHNDDGRRTIDVGLDGPAFPGHQRRHRDEQRGEDLRLMYVALTRARHQAVVWWAGSWDSRDSALGRLLFAREADGTVAPAGSSTASDVDAWRRFAALADGAPGCVSVERSSLGPFARWSGQAAAGAELAAARFDRELDRRWRRTSYSDITAGTYEARVASEPEEDVVDDEAPDERPPAPEDPGTLEDAVLRTVPSLLGDMPVGVQVGTFVHRVFERADFAAPDLEAELRGQVAEALERRPVDVGDPAAVVRGLRAAIETPLGPLVGGRRLRDVTRADRLDELAFELPLAGGDVPSGRLTLRAVADALRAHLAPGDPLLAYADRLEDPGLRSDVRGYLTGSLDLVVRTGGRYAVVDYKTNWLGTPDEPLTAWHHRPAALAEEMRHAHYGLQALLYTVALHRYLRWRLPGYAPGEHLAGVLYLFLRGMTGPDTPLVDGTPCGVFAWRPPAALVEALSDVLDGAA